MRLNSRRRLLLLLELVHPFFFLHYTYSTTRRAVFTLQRKSAEGGKLVIPGPASRHGNNARRPSSSFPRFPLSPILYQVFLPTSVICSGLFFSLYTSRTSVSLPTRTLSLNATHRIVSLSLLLPRLPESPPSPPQKNEPAQVPLLHHLLFLFHFSPSTFSSLP